MYKDYISLLSNKNNDSYNNLGEQDLWYGVTPSIKDNDNTNYAFLYDFKQNCCAKHIIFFYIIHFVLPSLNIFIRD